MTKCLPKGNGLDFWEYYWILTSQCKVSRNCVECDFVLYMLLKQICKCQAGSEWAFWLRTNALSYCWFVWSVRVSVPAETTVGCEIVRRMLDYVPKTERQWLTYIYSFYIMFTLHTNRSMTVPSFSILFSRAFRF